MIAPLAEALVKVERKKREMAKASFGIVTDAGDGDSPAEKAVVGEPEEIGT